MERTYGDEGACGRRGEDAAASAAAAARPATGSEPGATPGRWYADLHVHTDHSDGTQPIERVLADARDRGLRAVAITDHDTVSHWDEVRRVSEQLGIEPVRGVEMSCYDERVRKKIHVVGLWLGKEVPHVAALCEHTLTCRDRYHRTLVGELRDRGYDITCAEVEQEAPYGLIFKMHLFKALAKKYPDEMTPARYRELFAGKTAYEVDRQMGYTPIAEGIATIRADGGIPVIAHPCEYDNYDEIPDYVAWGLAGIEIRHPSMQEADYPRMRALAERFGLVRSGGSDYHDPRLTPYLGRFGVTEEEFAAAKRAAGR